MDKREHTFVFTENDVVLLSIALENVDFSKIKETLKNAPNSYGDINQQLESWKKIIKNNQNINKSRFLY